jgi:hypothetical protein
MTTRKYEGVDFLLPTDGVDRPVCVLQPLLAGRFRAAGNRARSNGL